MKHKTSIIIRAAGLLLAAALLLGTFGCLPADAENTAEAKDTPHESTTMKETATGIPETAKTEVDGYELIFSDMTKVENTVAEYSETEYAKEIAPYKVESDLSNIVNLDQYGDFTTAQKALLAKNGFVVMESDQNQLYHIYEQNEYLKIPSFVTSDSVLQVYHLFFDYALRTLEETDLYTMLQTLTQDMLVKSIAVYESISEPEVKELSLANVAYFTVAAMCLDLDTPSGIPAEAAALAQQEMELVEDAGGMYESHIFGFDVDYSMFTVRGHYTVSDELRNYFRAMMWYGRIPFSFYKNDSKTRDELQTARAAIMVYTLFLNEEGGDKGDTELWNNIYEPTSFFVGDSDEYTPYAVKDMIVAAYGETPVLNMLLDKDLLDKFYTEVDNAPEPRIQSKITPASAQVPQGKQFRFMGQRYVLDSEILMRLVDANKRPMPTGLDVMGVLGSERAYDILINDYKTAEKWNNYIEEFEGVKSEVDAIPKDTWTSNMYYGWLWTLKSEITPMTEGYPSFMLNDAWLDKSLNTALASWAELRHDTILYADQEGAECGGDSPPIPRIKGYVEPNIEVYRKLLWLTQYSKENLRLRGILPEDLDYGMERFESLLSFLINCSEKELRNEELTEEEYEQILIYGGMLEGMTEMVVSYDYMTQTNSTIAVIADVHRAYSTYLEEAVGGAAQIFVVVPINGKLYLNRGAIFRYYEFASNSRLTDEQWQGILEEGNEPPQPEWTGSYYGGEKNEIPVPVEPYSSGC